MVRALGVTILGLALVASSPARAAKPGKSVKSVKPEIGELSHAGTRRGGLEFGLGALLTATAGGLIGFGAQQFVRARAHASFCGSSGGSSSGIDPCTFDPPPLGYASAGLSWGFSAALVVGAGLLFARGVRVHADKRAHDRVHISLAPWWRAGGGATLRVHF